MNTELEKLKQLLASLELEAKIQQRLEELIQRIQKRYHRLDFMHKRTLKDKSIAVNLLNTTITDLQEKKAYIESTNEQLLVQKQEIEEKNKELEQSYQELEQFAYIASHDLKSPLRSITSFGQLLQKRHANQLNSEGNEFVTFIIENAGKMDTIIEDLLKYSWAGGNKKALELADLEHQLEVAKINLHEEIKTSKATIQNGPLPQLYVIKKGISQLFYQLISNAIKFTKPDQPPQIQIGVKQEGLFWHFTVSDNGIGLDESFHDKVFQPHQRFGEGNKRHTGMGLAICRKIVRLHDGQIWYTTIPEEGTTFHFTIRQ